ncbi:hypothetical protein [Nesterenkonia populi]
MRHRTLSTATALSTALLALTACTSDDEGPPEPAGAPETEAQGPSPEESLEWLNEEEQEADHSGDGISDAEITSNDEPGEASPSHEDLPSADGITLYEHPSQSIMAPNGEGWTVDGSIDPDTLQEADQPPNALDLSSAETNCEENWPTTQALWLRAHGDGGTTEGPQDYFYDNYDDGPTEGPLCFNEPGGAPANPEYRLVHYICQSSNTTSRTLVSTTEGDSFAWTPEYTTDERRACFHFGGEEVRAYAVEATSH